MSETNKCPECGAELGASAPRGFCPACLLKRGLETNTVGNTAEGAAAARWMPPGVEELAVRFPELEIARLIGRGGMGAVYQARQKNLDRVVALKILPPEMGHDVAFAERFTREAQAMARLNHPHIVTIHEFGERAGWYYFVMEYVDGVSLRGLLDAGHVAPSEALAIVPQICEALQYAHDQGIVHRDIKPENILLNTQGQVKIADFGLAKLMGRTAPAATDTTEKVMGTPQYMAPEQLDRPAEVDHRADIYSLGVVFYRLLTGELPTGAGDRFAAPSTKVQIDVRLDQIVLRALEKSPQLRYQNASEFKTEIETVLATPPPAAPSLATARSASGPPEPSAASAAGSPVPDPALPDRVRRAQQDLKIPAIGLRIAAFLNLLLILVIVLAFVVDRIFLAPPTSTSSRGGLVSIPPIFLGLFVNLFIVRSAIRMAQCRDYSRAVAASILAMLAFPANLLGLPMGIWSLILLSRREIKAAFDVIQAAGSTNMPSRTPSAPPTPRVALFSYFLSTFLLIALGAALLVTTQRFTLIFQDLRAPLPILTEPVLHAAHFFGHPLGFILLIFLAGLVRLPLLLLDLIRPDMHHGLLRRSYSHLTLALAGLVSLITVIGVYLPMVTLVQRVAGGEGDSPKTPQVEAAAPTQAAAILIAPARTGDLNVYLHAIGSITGPPGPAPLATRPNGSPVTVAFSIPEDSAPPVIKDVLGGRKLAVELFDGGLQKRLAQGSLVGIDNQYDLATRTLGCRALVTPIEDELLLPNQFVNVRLLLETRYGVTLVPTAAVWYQPKSIVVYVISPDQTVATRPVRLGATDGPSTEITAGLSPGETVVIQGALQLHDGEKLDLLHIATTPAGPPSAR